MNTSALTQDQRFRLAAGRKKYNRGRRSLANWRRRDLMFVLDRTSYELPEGWIEAQAQEHDVSVSTIYRDLQAIHFRRLRQMWRDAMARSIAKHITKYGPFPDMRAGDLDGRGDECVEWVL